MIYRETEEITKEERKNVFDKLLAYNLSHLEDKNPRELGIFLEDEEGNCQGGLIGMTHGKWNISLWMKRSADRIWEANCLSGRNRLRQTGAVNMCSWIPSVSRLLNFIKRWDIKRYLCGRNIRLPASGIIL